MENMLVTDITEKLNRLESGQSQQLVQLGVLDERTLTIKNYLEKQNGRITYLERRDWILGGLIVVVGVVSTTLGLLIH